MSYTFLPLHEVLSNKRDDDCLIAFNKHDVYTLKDLRTAVSRLLALTKFFSAPSIIPTATLDLSVKDARLASFYEGEDALGSTNRLTPDRAFGLYFEDSFNFVVAMLALWYAHKDIVLISELDKEDDHAIHKGLTILSDRDITYPNAFKVNAKELLADATFPHASLAALASDVVDGNAIPSGWGSDLNEVRALAEALSDEFAAGRSALHGVEVSHIHFLTSGSTGKPSHVIKGIGYMMRESELLFSVLSQRAITSSHHAVLASVYPHHLYGLSFSVMLPLCFGLAFCTKRSSFIEALCDDLIATNDKVKPYLENPIFVTSPAFMRYSDEKLTAKPLKLVISAGGVLAEDIAVKFLEWSQARLFEIYGSTETGVVGYRYFGQMGGKLCHQDLNDNKGKVSSNTATLDDKVVSDATAEKKEGLLDTVANASHINAEPAHPSQLSTAISTLSSNRASSAMKAADCAKEGAHKVQAADEAQPVQLAKLAQTVDEEQEALVPQGHDSESSSLHGENQGQFPKSFQDESFSVVSNDAQSEKAWYLFDAMSLALAEDQNFILSSPLVKGGRFKLNDNLLLLSERRFILKGRSDSIIKIDEKRYSLKSVKNAVLALSYVSEVEVVPFTEKGRTLLAAFIKLNSLPSLKDAIFDEAFMQGKVKIYAGKEMDKLKKAWRQELIKVLDPKVVPRRFVVLEDFPHNEMGKIQQSALKALL